jgi:PAH dioxygenase large subunit
MVGSGAEPNRGSGGEMGQFDGLVDVAEGVLSARIFVDEAIYAQEVERVFGRAWLYLAHESELPRPGSYVTRLMGEDPVIVCRGADGAIRVFLNVCRHRGRRVCEDDLGQAASFTCPYHGWTYSPQGELVGVPFLDAYQGRLDVASLGFVQPPRVAVSHGLIFASWAAAGPTLEDYLGPMGWVFDLLFGRSEAMEVVGPPQRWVATGNWKLAAANFAGDGHHIFTTHGFRTALGLETIKGERVSYVLPSTHGHACTLSCWPHGVEDLPYARLPRELWPELERKLTREQLDLLSSLAIIVGNIFPNCSFLQTSSHLPDEWGGNPADPPVSFLTIRQWQPRGPRELEVWSWQLLDRNAPQQWKDVARACFTREFGMAGIFEQDDLENWGEITKTLSTPAASRLTLQYRMGLSMTAAGQWPGPGEAFVKKSFEELNERVFYGHWQKLISTGD